MASALRTGLSGKQLREDKDNFKCGLSEQGRLGDSLAQPSPMSDRKLEVAEQCLPQSPW